MKTRFKYLARVGWPIPTGIILFLIAVLAQDVGEGGVKINLWFFSFPLNSETAIRAGLITFAVLLLVWPAIRDYARLFPTDLYANLYYGREGLRDALKEIPCRVQRQMNVEMDEAKWAEEREQILDLWGRGLDEESRAAVPEREQVGIIPFRLDSDTKTLAHVEFKVSFVRPQVYSIKTARGFLEHTYRVKQPDGTFMSRDIQSEFRLSKGKQRLVMSLLDIYFRWYTIFTPTFELRGVPTGESQTARESELAYSATKLRLFPFLIIGTTIYFGESKETGKLIPVAYGEHGEIE